MADLDYGPGPICCRGGCCGPGSYCCGHPGNQHEHDEDDTPSTIRDVREPGRPTLQDSDTLTKVRAAHTEYRNTGDLHELARALNTLLGT